MPDNISKFIGFGVTALWWLVVTLPLLKNYKQKNYVERDKITVKQTFSKIFSTLKKIATEDKKVLFFLIAFFLYIDGVGTIIDNCINIGTDLNLNTVGPVSYTHLDVYKRQGLHISGPYGKNTRTGFSDGGYYYGQKRYSLCLCNRQR